MKTIQKTLALVVVAFSLTAVSVSAHTSAVNPGYEILGETSLSKLENFLVTNKRSLLKTQEYAIFAAGVRLFNENRPAFMQVSDYQKNSFNVAAEKVSLALGKIRKAQVTEYQELIGETVRQMNASWNFNAHTLLPAANADEAESIL
jgi:hypothetical protein